MSSLLFLVEIAAFVLLARWAYRNDSMGNGESGAGLFAMHGNGVDKRGRRPRWERTAHESDAGEKRGDPKGPRSRWKTAPRRPGEM